MVTTYNLPKRHFSYSQMDLYQSCPKAYWYRYVDKQIEEPPYAHLSFGTVIHRCMQFNYAYKLQSGEDRAYKDVLACFLGNWEQFRHMPFADHGWTDYLTLGTTMLKHYMEEVAPPIFPMLIEQEYTFTLDDGLLFNGILDLFTRDGCLVDFKTAKKVWTQKRALDNMQLTSYAWMLKQVDVECKQTAIHCFAKDTGKVHVLYGGQRSDGDITGFRQLAKCHARNISNGIFPTTPQPWKCNPDFCAYHAHCKG